MYPVYCFLGMVGFYSNFRREKAFQVESDDLLFVSNRSDEIMDVTPGGQNAVRQLPDWISCAYLDTTASQTPSRRNGNCLKFASSSLNRLCLP